MEPKDIARRITEDPDILNEDWEELGIEDPKITPPKDWKETGIEDPQLQDKLTKHGKKGVMEDLPYSVSGESTSDVSRFIVVNNNIFADIRWYMPANSNILYFAYAPNYKMDEDELENALKRFFTKLQWLCGFKDWAFMHGDLARESGIVDWTLYDGEGVDRHEDAEDEDWFGIDFNPPLLY